MVADKDVLPYETWQIPSHSLSMLALTAPVIFVGNTQLHNMSLDGLPRGRASYWKSGLNFGCTNRVEQTNKSHLASIIFKAYI